MPNKKRRCLCCREYFDKEDMIKLPAGWFCSFDHAAVYARNKAEKMRQKERNRAKKARKDKFYTNDTRKQHVLTQAAFNKMRRFEELLWFKERGLDPVCISCGKPKGNDQWACGHFKTRGAQSGLRYDRKNTYLQHNFSCNKNLSGDIEGTKTTRGFKAGLLERFGQEEGQKLIDYCESKTEVVKFTGEQLIKMRKEFNAKIREIKTGIQN